MIEEKGQNSAWICDKCKEKLVLSKVKASYLSGNFEVDLLKCPVCGNVYIGEELALGKMLEVEKTLEDK
jgi:rubrerythrin